MPTRHSTDNIVEFTVSELAHALKRTIEDSYGWVRVRGELSGCKRAASGHLYFALKDEKAVLDAVCWRTTASRLGIEPEDGLEVVCLGRLTTYPQRSRYQLVVESVEPAGLGALMALLEERKRKLAAEGLFAAERKRPLPYLPDVIGIVTSPGGAVIRDILHRLEERFPRRVLLWPVLVQGEGAAQQIAQAIAGFARLPAGGSPPRPDLLIVARGGGSIEDLWPFNEEVVARAAAACPIPLISAVGHETDTTLIDLVADRRAPTPTAAAEMAVPVRRELLDRTRELGERQRHAVQRLFERHRRQMEALARGLRDPRLLLATALQRLDDLAERLRFRSPLVLLRERREQLDRRHRRLVELAEDARTRAVHRFEALSARLRTEALVRELGRLAERCHRETERMARSMEQLIRGASRRLEAAAQQLEALSHRRVLERGYVVLHRARDGSVVPSLASVGNERRFLVEFHDGTMEVARGAAARGNAATREEEQPELF